MAQPPTPAKGDNEHHHRHMHQSMRCAHAWIQTHQSPLHLKYSCCTMVVAVYLLSCGQLGRGLAGGNLLVIVKLEKRPGPVKEGMCSS